MSTNPILSDYDILNFCNLNKNNQTCSCINPPNNISIISKNFFQPYFCWYRPCLSNTYLKTNYIINEQLNCNSTNCQISIGDINITADNKIYISNNCASGISNNIYINENQYQYKPLDIILLDYKYLSIILVFFLITLTI